MEGQHQENIIQKKVIIQKRCITSDKIDLKPRGVISDRKDIYH